MIPSTGLAVPPLLAAALLVALHATAWRRRVDQGACLLVLLLALVLPWMADAPAPSAADLLAILFAAGALTDAVAGPSRHRFVQAAGQLRLAAMLLALRPADPLVSLLFLALASTAGAARRLPRTDAVAARLLAGNVSLGLALFGVVALQAGSVPIGGAALLLGWGALVVLDPTLLPLVLLLALRLQAATGAESHGNLVGNLMVAGGLGVLLASAAVLLLRRPGLRRLPNLTTLAQGGVALCGFGLGGPDLRFAGLVHLALLTLSRSALLLSGEAGLDRLASLLGLSGLPPIGLFPSLALIVGGIAVMAPWLLLPMAVGLVGLGWVCVASLPAAVGPAHLSPAWLPLVLALLLGFAMPAPIAAWFHAMAVAPP
ncbi:MAG: hypothetical protein P4L71_16660 [Acetobacteraceae bacterium]|nr:hypothetical protein [Acetobacteraceae bacterium]